MQKTERKTQKTGRKVHILEVGSSAPTTANPHPAAPMETPTRPPHHQGDHHGGHITATNQARRPLAGREQRPPTHTEGAAAPVDPYQAHRQRPHPDTSPRTSGHNPTSTTQPHHRRPHHQGDHQATPSSRADETHTRPHRQPSHTTNQTDQPAAHI